MSPGWSDGLVNAFPIPDPVDATESCESPSSAVSLDPDAEMPSAPQSLTTCSSFPFFSLPAEVRERVYTIVLCDQLVSRRIKPPVNRRLPTSLFLTSSRVHREASYIFYNLLTFKIFPIQEFNPLPTVVGLAPRYRPLIKNAELILGPGWSEPVPRSSRVTNRMVQALGQLRRMRCLRVFVEIDVGAPWIAKYKPSCGYIDFAGKLLEDVLRAMPLLRSVLIEANPSVRMDGPTVSRLKSAIADQGKVLRLTEEPSLRAPH